jgi:hypothetical protein
MFLQITFDFMPTYLHRDIQASQNGGVVIIGSRYSEQVQRQSTMKNTRRLADQNVEPDTQMLLGYFEMLWQESAKLFSAYRTGESKNRRINDGSQKAILLNAHALVFGELQIMRVW